MPWCGRAALSCAKYAAGTARTSQPADDDPQGLPVAQADDVRCFCLPARRRQEAGPEDFGGQINVAKDVQGLEALVHCGQAQEGNVIGGGM